MDTLQPTSLSLALPPVVVDPPVASVVIPCLNEEASVEACRRSEERLTVLAASLVIVGAQIFLSSFLLSIFGPRRRR